jgi:hypothetical protein
LLFALLLNTNYRFRYQLIFSLRGLLVASPAV